MFDDLRIEMRIWLLIVSSLCNLFLTVAENVWMEKDSRKRIAPRARYQKQLKKGYTRTAHGWNQKCVDNFAI